MKSSKNKTNKMSVVSLENITQLQKIAIEGEMAKAISTARHDEEILYRYWAILKKAPRELSYLLVQIFRDMVDIKQELLDKVTLEVSLDIAPLWLWVEKTVADLKLSMKLACADQLGDASINRKALQKKLIKSAFVFFVRDTAMISPTAALALCNHIINEEPLELGYLEDVCFALIPEISELDQDEKVNEEVIHTMFDINKVLSYKIETEVLEGHGKKKKSVKSELKNKDIEDGFVDFSEMLKKTINEILETQQEEEKKETGKFIVIKEYEGCDVSTPLRECNSQEEAEQFIESMKKQFPELLKTVHFRICKR